jgi:hypothetical protein
MSSSARIETRRVVRDDRILRETKWLAAFIIPFLVAAFYILYLRPTHTGELFAWKIAPTMTAMMLASAYVGGIYYFTGVLLAKRWHHVKAGLWPIIAFVCILAAATLLHWDRFNHSHISFFTWTALYLATPFLLVAVWLRNRVTDPGTPDPDDSSIPPIWRWVMGAVGGIALTVCALLFVWPSAMISAWPWALTPLTARVTAAMFALPGLVGIGIALDPRWSSARLILQAQAFSLAFILLGAFRAWGEFDASSPVAYVFIGGLSVMLLGILALYVFMGSHREREPAHAIR